MHVRSLAYLLDQEDNYAYIHQKKMVEKRNIIVAQVHEIRFCISTGFSLGSFQLTSIV